MRSTVSGKFHSTIVGSNSSVWKKVSILFANSSQSCRTGFDDAEEGKRREEKRERRKERKRFAAQKSSFSNAVNLLIRPDSGLAAPKSEPILHIRRPNLLASNGDPGSLPNARFSSASLAQVKRWNTVQVPCQRSCLLNTV